MPFKNFVPAQVGQLEVTWWQAHNDHNSQLLYQSLLNQHIALYGLSEESARQAVAILVQAVKFHDIRDWPPAIQTVAKYYEVVKKTTKLSYDPLEVAKLEVGWWRLHDDLEKNPDKSALADAFAALYAAIFSLPKEELSPAGRLKAEATREHDLAEDPATPAAEVAKHWQKAGLLLVRFYTQLQSLLGKP